MSISHIVIDFFFLIFFLSFFSFFLLSCFLFYTAGAACDADIGFQETFSLMLILPALVILFATGSFMHGQYAVAHRMAVIKQSSPALREFESVICYEELFGVVDVDDSRKVDALEFVDLLKLCGYDVKDKNGKSDLNESLAEHMLQTLTGSEHTTELSKSMFVDHMRTGNLGRLVQSTIQKLKEEEEGRSTPSRRKSKPQHRSSNLLQDSDALISTYCIFVIDIFLLLEFETTCL